MPNNSSINPKMSYNETIWVVSHVNLGTLLLGHSALLIEGILSPTLHADYLRIPGRPNRKAGVYTVQAHITAKVFKKPQSSVFESINKYDNHKGVIRTIGVFENTTRDYSDKPGQSYYIESDKVISLIEKLIQEQAELKKIWDSFDSDPTDEALCEMIQRYPYQMYGHHLLFGQKDSGINCTEWCDNQLKDLGIMPGPLGQYTPKPKIGAGQCQIV